MPTPEPHWWLGSIPHNHRCPPMPHILGQPQTYPKQVMTSAIAGTVLRIPLRWLQCDANIKMIRIRERIPFLFHILERVMCIHRTDGVSLRTSLRPHISVLTLKCSSNRNIFHPRNLSYPNGSLLYWFVHILPCKITVFVRNQDVSREIVGLK